MRNSNGHLQHSVFTLWWILAAIVGANLIDSPTLTMAQRPRVTLEVDETTIYKPSPRRKVKRYDEIVADDDQVVRATQDRDNEAVKIQGLKEGRSVVTFSGVSTRLVLSGRLKEEEVRFSGSVLAVVLPPRPLVRPAVKNYLVEPRQSKRTDLEYFLGPRFARRGESRAISARLQPFNSSVAQVELDLNGTPEITITGADAGRVMILLSGEQRLQNSWQKVTRSIEVYVPKRDSNRIASANPGNSVNPDASGPPIETIKALESSYESNKFLADNARSEEEKRRAIEELKKLAVLIKLTVERERRSAQPRPTVLSRLSALLEKTLGDIKRLETPPVQEPAEDVPNLDSLAGVWSLYRDGNKVRDGYRIEARETNIGTVYFVSNSESQQWFYASPREGSFGGYEYQNELNIGTNTIELRPRSSFQLDIWKRMQLTDEKLQFTGYYLLRDSR